MAMQLCEGDFAMRKLLLTLWMMSITATAWSAPAPIDNTVQPCDSSQLTEKPPCNADAESVTIPAPTPDDRGSVIVPPAPKEGLPSQDKKALPAKALSPNKKPGLEKR